MARRDGPDDDWCHQDETEFQKTFYGSWSGAFLSGAVGGAAQETGAFPVGS